MWVAPGCKACWRLEKQPFLSWITIAMLRSLPSNFCHSLTDVLFLLTTDRRSSSILPWLWGVSMVCQWASPGWYFELTKSHSLSAASSLRLVAFGHRSIHRWGERRDQFRERWFFWRGCSWTNLVQLLWSHLRRHPCKQEVEMSPASWIGNWSRVEGSNGTCKEAGTSKGLGGGIVFDDSSSAFIIGNNFRGSREGRRRLCTSHRQSGWIYNERRIISNLRKWNGKFQCTAWSEVQLIEAIG